MKTFDIKEIDFLNLDIDKYLDWLLNKYRLFSSIAVLVALDNIIIDLSKRKYFANTHFMRTREKPLPPYIADLYSQRIKHFEQQKTEYKGLELELISFKSVSYRPINGTPREYGFFSKDELKNINIDISDLVYWIEKDENTGVAERVHDIEKKRQRSPLKDEAFYKKELSDLLNDLDRFAYLPQILESQFIFNLDDPKNALSFATEIDNIRVAIYLTERIQGQSQKLPITKPLKWSNDINVLVTLFGELLNTGLIQNERGAKENIKRMIIQNFTDIDGKDFSKNYIDEILKLSKMKLDKTTADFVNKFATTLHKTAPKDK